MKNTKKTNQQVHMDAPIRSNGLGSAYYMTAILASLNKCVLELKGKGYSLYSNKTFTEGEFGTLAEVVDALANDPSFSVDK